MPTSQENDSSTELELTKESQIKNDPIEELKLKLGNKEIEDTDTTTNMIPESNKRSSNSTTNNTHLNEDGLIIPRKLPNPVMENPDQRNLQRELLFNQKIGKNVLNSKSELQKVFTKLNDKKGLDTQIEAKKQHELEKAIADRAKRRQDAVPADNEDDKGLSKEFLEARAKLRTRTESK